MLLSDLPGCVPAEAELVWCERCGVVWCGGGEMGAEITISEACCNAAVFTFGASGLPLMLLHTAAMMGNGTASGYQSG